MELVAQKDLMNEAASREEAFQLAQERQLAREDHDRVRHVLRRHTLCQRSLRKEVAAVSSELEALQEGAGHCRREGFCSSPQPLAGDAPSPVLDLAGDAKRRCGGFEEEPELSTESRLFLERGALQLSSKSIGSESCFEGTATEALLSASPERAPARQAVSSASATTTRGRFASAARRARLGQPRQVPLTSRSHEQLHRRRPAFTSRGHRRGCTASSPGMSAGASAPLRESEAASPVPNLRSPSDSEGQHAAFLSAYARQSRGTAHEGAVIGTCRGLPERSKAPRAAQAGDG